MPAVYAQLEDVYKKLEAHYRDMQDIEFTIQSGKLYLLQTRTGKRTGFAAVKIACDMVDEGLINNTEAVARVEAGQIVQLLAPVFDAKEKQKALTGGRLLGRGLPAGPGAAAGRIAFNAERAVSMAKDGPGHPRAHRDVARGHRRHAQRGGHPHHARRTHVARGRRRARHGPAVHRRRRHRCASTTAAASCAAKGTSRWKKATGSRSTARPARSSAASSPRGRPKSSRCCSKDSMKPEESEIYRNFDRLLKWADEIRTLGVRTNADTPNDARVARLFGAAGIGLCRTEHMFFAEERILRVREMILARNEAGRRKALDAAAAVSEGRLRRHLPRARRHAGHDPPARSAAARVPAAERGSRSPPSRATWAGASSSCARK